MNDKKSTEQVDKFKQAARELGCDEDEARFDETLKRLRRPLDKEREAIKEAAKGKPKKNKPGE